MDKIWLTFYFTRMSCQICIYTVSHPFAYFPGGKPNKAKRSLEKDRWFWSLSIVRAQQSLFSADCICLLLWCWDMATADLQYWINFLLFNVKLDLVPKYCMGIFRSFWFCYMESVKRLQEYSYIHSLSLSLHPHVFFLLLYLLI